MPELRERPERIDLAQADDIRDVIHRAVACLAGGGVVGLPTESGRAFLSAVLPPRGANRLFDFRSSDLSHRPTLLLRHVNEVADWVPPLSKIGCRLAKRSWPGPITLTVPVPRGYGLSGCLPDLARDTLFHEDRVALRVPPDGLLREILRLTPGPVASIDDVTPRGEAAGTDKPRIEIENIDMIIDDGKGPVNLGPTVVSIDEDRWMIDRAGIITEEEIAAIAGTIWLFVCTGNTCRSPMAEAICKIMLAKRLGCAVDELIQKGHVVMSAGVAAGEGMPAAAHAIEVIAARGGSLKRHASCRATDSLIRHADHIFALAGEHLDILIDNVPDAAEKIRMLDPNGYDIVDPIGSDRAMYHDTAQQIEESLGAWLDEIGI
jgi:L-threonylcarbamoyladenylate synthase